MGGDTAYDGAAHDDPTTGDQGWISAPATPLTTPRTGSRQRRSPRAFSSGPAPIMGDVEIMSGWLLAASLHGPEVEPALLTAGSSVRLSPRQNTSKKPFGYRCLTISPRALPKVAASRRTARALAPEFAKPRGKAYLP